MSAPRRTVSNRYFLEKKIPSDIIMASVLYGRIGKKPTYFMSKFINNERQGLNYTTVTLKLNNIFSRRKGRWDNSITDTFISAHE